MDFIDFIDPEFQKASKFNVYRREDFVCSVCAIKSKNKITVKHSEYDFKKDDVLIDEKTNCRYVVRDIQVFQNPPIGCDVILSVYIPSETPARSISIGTVNGGNVVIDSQQVDINNQILQLPEQDQAIAKELLDVLNECLRNKSLPKKTFGEKFAGFISKYGALIPAFGNLALQILAFVRG